MLSDDGGQQRIFMYCAKELCMCECSSDKRLRISTANQYIHAVSTLTQVHLTMKDQASFWLPCIHGTKLG